MAGDDQALRSELRRISRRRPRWGYRRAHQLLLEEGWTINRKRTQRLWREEGLRVPRRRRKRQRVGESTVPAERLRAERPDHVWALDFQFDLTADGRILKLLHVVDEFTREALAIECHRRIDADKTVATLDRLVGERGTAPAFIRCDNGPELTANALKDWCRFSRAGSAYIEPGSPWQNPYVESFGSRIRDELLAVELLSCPAEARMLVEDWRQDYNQHRPHSALGMMTPRAFGAGYRTYLETVSEHLSPPGGTEQWLAETTINIAVFWRVIDDQQAPEPEYRNISLLKLSVALLIEGALFSLIRGLVDHGSRHVFTRITGAWPGDEKPEAE